MKTVQTENTQYPESTSLNAPREKKMNVDSRHHAVAIDNIIDETRKLKSIVATKTTLEQFMKFVGIGEYWNEMFGQHHALDFSKMDPEIHTKLIKLYQDKIKYQKLLDLSNQCLQDTKRMVETQMKFGDLLKEEFGLDTSGERQCRIAQAQQPVILSLHHLIKNIETVLDKSIKDSISSSNRLSDSRIKLEQICYDLRTNKTLLGTWESTAQLNQELKESRVKYDRNREELLVKLEFLEENKNRVLQELSKSVQLCTFVYFCTVLLYFFQKFWCTWYLYFVLFLKFSMDLVLFTFCTF